MAKKNVHIMDMVLEWAKVFKENPDTGSPEGPAASKAVYQKGGQYIVNAYFTSDEQLDLLREAGMDFHPMNSNRVLDGNNEYGIGKYMKLKRLISDVKTFTNSDGNPVEIDYGGTPNVVDHTKGPENKRMWSFSEDGPLGNGTKAKVEFELYREGVGVRLLNIAVTDHVPLQEATSNEEHDELFVV